MASDFIRIAREEITDFKDKDDIKRALVEFFKELKKTGSEFGYRTSSEIFRFTGILRNLTEAEGSLWATDDIIDAAILQKLLPKLHGSKKKLEKVLESLGKLCFNKGAENPDDIWKKFVSDPDQIEVSDQVRFKRSLEKILRMKRRADQDGFTSFAEA
jgi:5-methylcytosine-specific restriction protein B